MIWPHGVKEAFESFYERGMCIVRSQCSMLRGSSSLHSQTRRDSTREKFTAKSDAAGTAKLSSRKNP